MALYRLKSDAWANILGYLDAIDIINLVCAGDSTLCTILKPGIRELEFCFRTTKSPRLSSLLSLVQRSSSQLRRLKISLGKGYNDLTFVKEQYNVEKWRTLFPSTLETLELHVECIYSPFSSLLKSLAAVAPQLTTFRSKSIGSGFTLPNSLTFLETGYSDDWLSVMEDNSPSTLIEMLPTTLTHLNLLASMRVESEIAYENISFKKMPLTVFHANIHFSKWTAEQASWDILPNTIVDLNAELSYGESRTPFPPQTEPSWAQLFPNLTSINSILRSLLDTSAFDKGEASLSEEKISSMFPASLTALNLASKGHMHYSHQVIPLIRAIGHRLRDFSIEPALDVDMLAWLPRWENPKVKILKSVHDANTGRQALTGDRNFEKFSKTENHPITRLYSNATNLFTEVLPASALPLLPNSLTTMTFLTCENEPLSLQSVSKAMDRTSPRNENEVNGTSNSTLDTQLGWSLMGWPKSLTKLDLGLETLKSPLHFGCLPATLIHLRLHIYDLLMLEGGDLAHMKNLKTFSVSSSNADSKPLITSLLGFPKSLKSLRVPDMFIANEVFTNADFQKFFDNFEELELKRHAYSADVLLYLPTTLTSLSIRTSRKGACWSEKQFENLSRCTKLAYLSLAGSAKWPDDLKFDVFSRYLPKALAKLNLDISDWEGKGFEEEISQHIPTRLLSVYVAEPKLCAAVRAKRNPPQSNHISWD